MLITDKKLGKSYISYCAFKTAYNALKSTVSVRKCRLQKDIPFK